VSSRRTASDGAIGSTLADAVLFTDMACYSLGLDTETPVPLRFDFVGGVPLFPGARVFITKVPPLHNRDFHEIFKIRFQIGTG